MNATRIVVGPNGLPWVLTADRAIQRNIGGGWERIDGQATDIAIGPGGTVWIVDSTLRRRTESGWETVGRDAVAVAVDAEDRPWIIDAQHQIHRLTADNGWEMLPGRATDIAIGPEGTVWALGAPPDELTEGFPIMRWNGAGWNAVQGAAVRIAVDPDGLPWVINRRNACFRLNRDNWWEDLPQRAIDVAVGARGPIWAIGETENSGEGGPVLNWGHNSFCILPFKELTLFQDGRVVPCCQFEGSLTSDDGGKSSIYTESMHDIWNSEDMRSIRHDMLAGKRISACRACYYVEEAGNHSLRMTSNYSWQSESAESERTKLAELEAKTRVQDYRLPAPGFLELGLGNLCNLKCRMCSGDASSRINRDPVHGKWNGTVLDMVPNHEHWWEQEGIRRDILRYPDQIDTLYLIGGEPGIIKEVGTIMKYLIDAGTAHQITISLTTNATTISQPWCELVGHFKQFLLHVSMDGIGKTYEYIRYPAHWDLVQRNIDFFRRLPKVKLKGALTFQAYNAVDIVELCRFLDSIDAPFAFSVFHSPVYLTTRVLPPEARRLAAARIREYVRTDCRPVCADELLAWAAGLELIGDEWDQDLFRQFMLFTNDLDVQRGQKMCESLPELWRLIEKTGVTWSTDTRYATSAAGNGTPAGACSR